MHVRTMQIEALDAEAAELALAAEAVAVAEAAERALAMKVLRISNATGPKAGFVSGLFELRGEKVNDRPVWKKSGMQRMHRSAVRLGGDV